MTSMYILFGNTKIICSFANLIWKNLNDHLLIIFNFGEKTKWSSYYKIWFGNTFVSIFELDHNLLLLKKTKKIENKLSV